MRNDRYLNHGPARQDHRRRSLALRLVAVCLALALLFSLVAGVADAVS